MADTRNSDASLFYLVAGGNEEALDELDRRYELYARKVAKDFLDTHRFYGFSYEDYYNTAMLGYAKARCSFRFETCDGFFPFFKTWAICELKKLNEEGSVFYMRQNPSSFLSLELPYNSDDDSMVLAEKVGSDDEHILSDLSYNELVMKITDSKSGLTELESVVASLIILRWDKRDIREYLSLDYKQLDNTIKNIHNKLDPYIKTLLK